MIYVQLACTTLSHYIADILLTIKSGRRTPIAEIPTPALAVPYAAPKQANTIAEVQPIAPKKGCERVRYRSMSRICICLLANTVAKQD